MFTDELETETGGGRVTEVATVSWLVRAFGGVRALVPGISVAVALAAVATLLGRLAPPLHQRAAVIASRWLSSLQRRRWDG